VQVPHGLILADYRRHEGRVKRSLLSSRTAQR